MQQTKGQFRIIRDYKHLAREFYSGTVFVAFDTETTGLHAESDFMLEIGAVKFSKDGIIGAPFDKTIKPPVPVPQFIEQLTGITDGMAQDGVSESSALLSFLSYLDTQNTVLIAHNAPFDLGFMHAGLERCALGPLKNKCIDTLPLARWAYPKLVLEPQKGQYKLQSLASRFCINVMAAHRASDDARVCMEVFKRILSDTMSVQKDVQCETVREGELF